MLHDMQADGGTRVEVLANFAVDLIPGSPDLGLQITAERSKVFIEPLAVASRRSASGTTVVVFAVFEDGMKLIGVEAHSAFLIGSSRSPAGAFDNDFLHV